MDKRQWGWGLTVKEGDETKTSAFLRFLQMD